MKSPIKHILLRKHKDYTENEKVFILNFTMSTKEILKTSNIFVKGLAINVAENLIKKEFGKETTIYVNLYDQLCWADQVIEEINTLNFSLKRTNIELYDKIHELEQYWINWGVYEINPKKYGDIFGHYIPIVKKYLDFQHVLKDMNKEFDKIYQNNLN